MHSQPGYPTEEQVENDAANVTQLNIKPKTTITQYMGDEITVQFDPKEGRWNWSIRAMRVVSFNGHAATDKAAFQKAQTAVDEMHGVRKRYSHDK